MSQVPAQQPASDRAPGAPSVPVAWLPPMRYPAAYLWLVFASTLDILLTWAILASGGAEVNPIARAVIDYWGLPGAVGFKFGLILLVIISCEVIGRRRDGVARGLAWFSVVVSTLPVVYSLGLLALHAEQLIGRW